MTPIPTSLGRIVSGSYAYQITPTDVLWLARSVHKEGGSNAATIWTYLQRQAASRRSSSLASLILAHSQPVNPLWRRDGEKCRPGGPYAGQDNCSPRLLDERDANAVRPWEAIPEEVRAAVVAAVTARLANPVPGATDFADQEVSQSFIRRNPGTRLVLKAVASRCPPCAPGARCGCNWYLDEGRISSPVFVELDGRRAGASSSAGTGFGTLLLAFAVGYGVYRWRKR
jgi:hypothetical protein